GDRDGDSLGTRELNGAVGRDYPALDLTWVVQWWADRPAPDDDTRVMSIATDVDVTRWRGTFRYITGNHPPEGSESHPAALDTSASQCYRGNPWVAFETLRMRNPTQRPYVYPGYDGTRLPVREEDEVDKGLTYYLATNPIKAANVPAFRDFYRDYTRDWTGN